MAGELAGYVKAATSDTEYVTRCENEAGQLVARFIGTATVPEQVKARAVLEVGADLFYRRATRNGVAGFDDAEPSPFRINRDPMAAAYPLLRPYMAPGLA